MSETAFLRREVLGYGLFALAAPAFAQPSGAGEIVSAAIHPAIGIARVGNSPTEFFYGPELPGLAPAPEGGFKDAAGRIRRQGVRFRIFGYDAAGRVVREITAREAQITWTVEIANLKSAWYRFHTPLDIPESQQQGRRLEATTNRRNEAVTGAAREGLAIRPGPRSLQRPNQRALFDTGRFLGRPVPLGEIRTDQRGRLTFLGGYGASFAEPASAPIEDYANNDSWCDDSSDGSVDATVRIGGREIPVRGAWVVTGPPDYAPGVTPVITLYDVVFAASAQPADRRPSFTREILPIFARMAENQWVNAGFAREFGHGGAHDFLAPANLRRLADAASASAAYRREMFAAFRNPNYAQEEPRAWPPYYGDQSGSPREHQALLPHQYAALVRWAAGDFDADLPAEGLRFASDEREIPLGELPGAIDRAAMDTANGAPFHPGIETGWAVRQGQMYDAPLRFKRRSAPEPDWGDELGAARATAADGPCAALAPGGLTRWLGVPWQADSINCGSGYDSSFDPYLPTYWPAIIPNDILRDAQYRELLAAQTPQARAAALHPDQRRKWYRGYDTGLTEPYRAFQQRWHQFGMIVERPGPPEGPQSVWVETERSLPEPEEKPPGEGEGQTPPPR